MCCQWRLRRAIYLFCFTSFWVWLLSLKRIISTVRCSVLFAILMLITLNYWQAYCFYLNLHVMLNPSSKVIFLFYFIWSLFMVSLFDNGSVLGQHYLNTILVFWSSTRHPQTKTSWFLLRTTGPTTHSYITLLLPLLRRWPVNSGRTASNSFLPPR